jgi:hypothetical protein
MRPPFRVSQIELRREFRSALEEARTGRPSTTTSRRVPSVLEYYGDGSRK